LSFGLTCVPQFWHSFLVGVCGFGVGTAVVGGATVVTIVGAVVGGIGTGVDAGLSVAVVFGVVLVDLVVLVLSSIETSLSWMLNIIIVDSQISRQPRLPNVSSASPPRIPSYPIEELNTEGRAPPIIRTNAPMVIRSAPTMYMIFMKVFVITILKFRKSSNLIFCYPELTLLLMRI